MFYFNLRSDEDAPAQSMVAFTRDPAPNQHCCPAHSPTRSHQTAAVADASGTPLMD